MMAVQPPVGGSLVAGLMEREFWGNSVRAWVVALSLVVVIQAVVWLVVRVARARLRAVAARTATHWDDTLIDVLSDVRAWCVLLAAAYAASRGLTLPDVAHKVLKLAAVVGVALQLLLSSRLVVEAMIRHVMENSKGGDGSPDPALASATTIIRFIATIVIGSLLTLVALANLNVEITPLITGLGIGGIAVALAAQSILGDLFASLSILFDKPFLVGDAIRVGEQSGTVERIGVKSTLVRAPTGELMVYRNTDLLGSRIHNFKQMKERRVTLVYGVVCETDSAGVRRAVEAGRRAAGGVEGVRFERCHFKTIGAYSFDIELVYVVTTPDFVTYMEAQQRVNLGLLDALREVGVGLAYPTQVAIQRT